MVLPLKLTYYGHDEDYDLSIDYPERNPYGMFAFRTNDVLLGTELIDIISIYKPLVDSRDKKGTKATLHEDGCGFTVTEPSVPSFLIKNVLEIHALEGNDVCQPTKQTHQVAANNIFSKAVRQNKQVNFMFPDGITCSADNFNNQKNGKLKNQFRVLDVLVLAAAGGRPAIKETIPFIFWKITIENEARHLERQQSEDSDDDYAKARERMENMSCS
jgi:hypothetical protein